MDDGISGKLMLLLTMPPPLDPLGGADTNRPNGSDSGAACIDGPDDDDEVGGFGGGCCCCDDDADC